MVQKTQKTLEKEKRWDKQKWIGTSKKWWWMVFGILLLLAAGLQAAARCVDGFADWYGTWIYESLVGMEGRFYGIFPVSVGEMLVYFIGIWLVLVTTWALTGLFRRDGKRRQRLLFFGKTWGMTAAVAFFLYTAQCGFIRLRQGGCYRHYPVKYCNCHQDRRHLRAYGSGHSLRCF